MHKKKIIINLKEKVISGIIIILIIKVVVINLYILIKLRNIIIHLQKSNTRKIQLTIAINIISSKDVHEEHVMQSRSDNIEFISCNDANEIVDELFK